MTSQNWGAGIQPDPVLIHHKCVHQQLTGGVVGPPEKSPSIGMMRSTQLIFMGKCRMATSYHQADNVEKQLDQLLGPTAWSFGQEACSNMQHIPKKSENMEKHGKTQCLVT